MSDRVRLMPKFRKPSTHYRRNPGPIYNQERYTKQVMLRLPPTKLALTSLLVSTACNSRPSIVADPTPESQLMEPEQVRFDSAIFLPEFQHVNSVWAGVALLDYDNDGWLDIFLTNGNTHPDALYRNLGEGTFIDVSSEAGVDSLGESGAVAAGDLDNDGDTDLVVSEACQTGTRPEDGEATLDGVRKVLLNQGDGTFTTHTVAIPLEDDADNRNYRCTTSVSLSDVDGDGYLDMVQSNAHDPDSAPPWVFDKYHPGGSNLVFYNNGEGDFEHTSADLGDEASFVAAHLDLDGDGTQDMLFGSSGHPLRAWTRDSSGELFENLAISDTGRGIWMGIAVADFDRDLSPDFYVTNQGLSPFFWGYDNLYGYYPGAVVSAPAFDDPTSEPSIQREWVNPFHDMHSFDESGVLRPHPTWTLQAEQLLAGDLFNDPTGGTYQTWENPTGLGRQAWGWGVVALDANADGWMDVAWTGNSCDAPMTIIWDEESGAGPGGLLINNGGTGFIDRTWEAGIANVDSEGRYVDGRGVATGDLNNDGYADLVIANRSYNPSHTDPLAQVPGTPRIWLSQERSGNWLQIDLEGRFSNRDGIGSIIEIESEDQEWIHWFGAGGSTNSSSERLLTVGLGTTSKVDITVTFPTGIQVTETEVEANQRITIVEDT